MQLWGDAQEPQSLGDAGAPTFRTSCCTSDAGRYDRRTKVASLLVDGLALDQWIALREVLGELDSKLRFREDLVFAWIPTITSVSRQAAFAGKPPIYFPASIHTTDKEAGLWTLAARGG
jgi:hypothetical protein